MATATAREFGDDGNGQGHKDAMVERLRAYTADGYDTAPQRIRNVGGAVVRAELTPYGWQQAATNAGYLTLQRALPRFDMPIASYAPTEPHGENYIG